MDDTYVEEITREHLAATYGKRPDVIFDRMDDAVAAITGPLKTPVFVGLGCMWSLPCVTALESMSKFRRDKRFRDVVLFCIDQDQQSEFCDRNDILLGTPILFVYFKGKALAFERKDRGTQLKFVGPFSAKQLEALAKACYDACSKGLTTVKLDF